MRRRKKLFLFPVQSVHHLIINTLTISNITYSESGPHGALLVILLSSPMGVEGGKDSVLQVHLPTLVKIIAYNVFYWADKAISKKKEKEEKILYIKQKLSHKLNIERNYGKIIATPIIIPQKKKKKKIKKKYC